jgi:competence protein ComEA
MYKKRTGRSSAEGLRETAARLLRDRRTVYKAMLVISIIIAASFMHLRQVRSDTVTLEKSSHQTASEETAGGEFYVDISGAVNEPGVYKVDSSTRVFELIEKAGGLSKDADIDQLNQAEFVKDGQKIVIPVKAGSAGTADADGSASAGSGGTSSAVSGLININTADRNQLMEIPGVGEVIAERIIDYRTSQRFASIEEIKNVKGIGDATFEKMRDLITV